MTIEQQLDRLAELQAQADVMQAHFDKLRDEIIAPEIRQQLDDIEAERTTAMDALNGGIAELTGEIKAAVIAEGTTIKGEYLQAVYSKPRVTWDTKGIEGFAAAHPEINVFRKIGQPSVSIRAVK